MSGDCFNNYLRRLPKEKAQPSRDPLCSIRYKPVCVARYWILITSDQQLTRKLSLSGAQIPVAATATATALCSGDMRGHSDGTQVLLWHCASVWIICGYKN